MSKPTKFIYTSVDNAARPVVLGSIGAQFLLGYICVVTCGIIQPTASYMPITALLMGARVYFEVFRGDNSYATILSVSSPVFLGAVFAVFSLGFIRIVRRRRYYCKMPGPPYSLLFGHLPILIKVAKSLPRDCHPHIMFAKIVEEYNLRDLFYIDVWPLSLQPQLLIIDPAIAAQVTQTSSLPYSLPKHPIVKDSFSTVLGKRSILTMNGEEWKEMRTMFNPSFSLTNIMSLVPMIVEETEIYASLLSAAAAKDGGYVDGIENFTMAVTVDIIGQVILGIKFRSQTSYNEIIEIIATATDLPKTQSDINIFEKVNFWRFAKLWYYEWKEDHLVRAEVRKRWEVVKQNLREGKYRGEKEKNLVVIDSALKKYYENLTAQGKPTDVVDDDFLGILTDNVKTFIFAGHDTSSSTLSYAYKELSQNSDALKDLCAEHDAVFGTDPLAAPDKIRKDPSIINNLPYTMAVIKEILRMYPPATTVRAGVKGFNVTCNGALYPTYDQLVWVPGGIIARNPSIYPSPTSFLPQRFLVPPPHGFPEIHKDAYRPFEKGPRHCIGQELAYVEMKILLVLTMRRFAFQEAWEERDRRVGVKKGIISIEGFGGRGYQVLHTTAKPKDGLPMWVKEII